MIIRNPWSTETWPSGGPYNSLGSVPGATPESLWREIFALAKAMEQAMLDIWRAESRGDEAYAQRRMQDLLRLKAIAVGTSQRIQEVADKQTVLGGLEAAVQRVPHAIAAVPNAFLEALRLILSKLGRTVWTGALPLIGLAVAGLLLLKGAESTRTGRRYLRG